MPPASAAIKVPLITDYAAGFIIGAKHTDISPEVARLGKRSVLDGIGLALAGANSECGHITRRYLESLGIASDKASRQPISRAHYREKLLAAKCLL